MIERTIAEVGGRLDGGAIVEVFRDDEGEQMARIVRAPFKGKPEFLNVSVDNTKVTPRSPNAVTVTNLAAFIAARRTPSIDSTESESHHAIRVLVGEATLRLHPIPAGFVPSDGVERPAGLVDRSSLIEPGMVVWAAKDVENAAAVQDRGEATDHLRISGGLVISISPHPSGNVFAVVSETAFAANVVQHLRDVDVHWCDTPDCPTCPRYSPDLARRMFRKAHRHIAATKGRQTPTSLRLVNVATTLERCAS